MVNLVMTYIPNTGAIVKGDKKGQVGKVKNTIVDRVLDSVARAAADADKKASDISRESNEKIEKINVDLNSRVDKLEKASQLQSEMVAEVRQLCDSLRELMATKEFVEKKEEEVMLALKEVDAKIQDAPSPPPSSRLEHGGMMPLYRPEQSQFKVDESLLKRMEKLEASPPSVREVVVREVRPEVPTNLKIAFIAQAVVNISAVMYILFRLF